MSFYKTTDWTSSEDTVIIVLAEMEAYIDTLDSTTEAILEIKIIALPDDTFVGTLLHKTP